MNSLTHELFYDNLYKKTFAATVISSTKYNNAFETILDATLFYPEGGGQYGDSGFIDQIKVITTYEKNNHIVHLTEEKLQEGKNVVGTIDFDRRYQNMQSHAGEHIISGIINKIFGYDNVGFHMNDDYVTMDYNGYIDDEQLKDIEKKCNEIISKNLPILEHRFSSINECNIDYRSKKNIDGQLRIIEIPNIDRCACCGTHTKTCGEIGLIHFIDKIKYKNGVRLTAVIGNNAYKRLFSLESKLKDINNILSCNYDSIVETVKNIKSLNSELHYKLTLLERENSLIKIQKLKRYNNIVYLNNCDLSQQNMQYLANNVHLEKDEILILEDNYRILIKSNDSLENLLEHLKNKKFISGGGKSNIINGRLNIPFNDLLNTLKFIK